MRYIYTVSLVYWLGQCLAGLGRQWPPAADPIAQRPVVSEFGLSWPMTVTDRLTSSEHDLKLCSELRVNYAKQKGNLK